MTTNSLGSTTASGQLLDFQKQISEKLSRPNGLESLHVPIVSNSDVWVFPSKSILKIVSSEKITHVPGSENFIVGVVSNDGVIYTLLDFNLLVGASPIVRNLKSRVLFLEHVFEDVPVAILVERVLELNVGPFIIDATIKPNSRHSLGVAMIDGEQEVFQMVNVESLFSPGI